MLRVSGLGVLDSRGSVGVSGPCWSLAGARSAGVAGFVGEQGVLTFSSSRRSSIFVVVAVVTVAVIVVVVVAVVAVVLLRWLPVVVAVVVD